MRLFYSLRPRFGCKVLWTACLHVCLFVRLFAFCLSACVSQNPHVQNSPNFLQMLLVAVARSFSDGIAICYVLPVLWMTSYFHIIQEICQNQRRHACFVHFARWRHQSDVSDNVVWVVWSRSPGGDTGGVVCLVVTSIDEQYFRVTVCDA